MTVSVGTQVIGPPDPTVGQEDPLRAPFGRQAPRHLDVAQVQFLPDPTNVDGGEELALQDDRVVDRVAAGAEFGGQVLVFAEVQPDVEEVGDEQSCVTVVGVAFHQLRERTAEPVDGGGHTPPDLGLPTRGDGELSGPGHDLGLFSVHAVRFRVPGSIRRTALAGSGGRGHADGGESSPMLPLRVVIPTFQGLAGIGPDDGVS